MAIEYGVSFKEFAEALRANISKPQPKPLLNRIIDAMAIALVYAAMLFCWDILQPKLKLGITDGPATTINLWSIIAPSLFAAMVLIIPKRAIPDPQTLEHFRSLIQTKIPRGTFLPRETRFQILPPPIPSAETQNSHSD